MIKRRGAELAVYMRLLGFMLDLVRPLLQRHLNMANLIA
jgi:hypothetical protein